MTAEFVQKISGEKLTVDNEIGKEYNEDSEEYKSLCNRYESVIGFKRDKNEEKFDKELLELLEEDLSKKSKEMLQNLIDEYKKSIVDKRYIGWIEFGGYVLNPLDFSAVKFTNFRTHIFKR